jgi:hypothetical protein
MSTYRVRHADAVNARVARLQSELPHATVSVEDENRFHVRGRAATVGGCADIVVENDLDIRVEDIKTGARQGWHRWQVLLYEMMLPLAIKEWKQKATSGVIIYTDPFGITVGGLTADERARINRTIAVIGAGPEPVRTPSPRECGQCDIACCPVRAPGEIATGDTEEF